MKSIMQWLTKPPVDGPRSVLLLRLMVGGVFFWEGVLKFVYVNQGVGRFTKLGMPFPAFTADFVGCLEIVGGLLLLFGLLTRLIAIPFVIEMIVAMLSTKISMYLGTSPLPLPPVPPQTGFWAVLHEIRSEYAQIMVALYLLINGPGKWSIDALLDKLRTAKNGDFIAGRRVNDSLLSFSEHGKVKRSSTNSHGQTIFVADAHRDDGKRFVVHADEKLTAFL